MSDERKDDKEKSVPLPPGTSPKRKERIIPIKIPNDPPEDEWIISILKNQKRI